MQTVRAIVLLVVLLVAFQDKVWSDPIERKAQYAPGNVPLSAPELTPLYQNKMTAGLDQPPAQGSDVAGRLLAELNEILESGNDNDPRLDRDFNALTPETKRLFRQRYAQAPVEARATRGTIVFLLGSNLDSPEDWAFLRSVVSEPRCLSLDNCSRQAPASTQHEVRGMGVTLAYPKLIALEAVRTRLEETRKPGNEDQGNTVLEAVGILRIAKASGEPIVADTSAEIATHFGLDLSPTAQEFRQP